MASDLFPWSIFAPRDALRTLDWSIAHANDQNGVPYDDFAYPHLGAPGGPLDALDCKQYLDLWLQWATRLGKSFVGQVGMMKFADCEPCPMLFTSVDRKLALEVTDRTVRMLRHCHRLSDQLPTRMAKQLIELAYCRMFVGWPRSPATLADKACRFGHANEIDKWEHVSTSKEADPLELFDERFKEFVTYKRLKEGSPALKKHSRVEPGRLAGTNARLEVACQRCGDYQPLDRVRVRYERDKGRPDYELAKRTARYICLYCEGENLDEDRGRMMRSGVWVPEGCTVNSDKAREAVERSRKPGRPLWGGFTEDADWLIGTPARDGTNYSSQLSSLYALSVTWGAIAAKLIDEETKPATRRNTKNSWWGETFDPVKRDDDWELLGKRLMITRHERGQVPPSCRYLVGAVDKQSDHFPVWVDAWTEDGQRHNVDHAKLTTKEELLDWLAGEFPGADGQFLRVSLVLMDFGYKPHGTHDLVARAKARGIHILPCKGASKALGTPYQRRRLGKDTSKPGARYILVDTISSQDWLDQQLHDIVPGTSGGMTMFQAPLAEQQDALQQLLNNAPVDSLGKDNRTRESWDKVDEAIADDFRDCARYSATAYLVRKNGHDGQWNDLPTGGWFSAQQKPKR